MRVLLDTHVFLWLHLDRDRLGSELEMLADPRHDLLLSAVSTWEIAIKWSLGRLTLPEKPTDWVPSRMIAAGASPVSVSQRQTLAVSELPPVHGDPFDRLLVSQARDLGASLMSADPVFARYDVDLIGAGDR